MEKFFFIMTLLVKLNKIINGKDEMEILKAIKDL
jgi:hypothetical protein